VGFDDRAGVTAGGVAHGGSDLDGVGTGMLNAALAVLANPDADLILGTTARGRGRRRWGQGAAREHQQRSIVIERLPALLAQA